MTAPTITPEAVKEWLQKPTHVEDLPPGTTRGQMLASLLLNLVSKEEEFSGKRPWGNSGCYSHIAWDLSDLDHRIGRMKSHTYEDETETWFEVMDWDVHNEVLRTVLSLGFAQGLIVPGGRKTK